MGYSEKKRGIPKCEERKGVEGSENYNWVEIDMLVILDKLIDNPFYKINDLANESGVSCPTLTKRIRSLLMVDNIQKFRQEKSSKELIQIYKKIKKSLGQ